MRKRASSASRDQLPFPSAVSPTSGRRISDADLEGNGQASPKVIVVRTKSSAEIPSRRGSVHRVAAEDSPLSARRSASSPRGFDPYVPFTMSSVYFFLTNPNYTDWRAVGFRWNRAAVLQMEPRTWMRSYS
jgi:hypothetical protein